MKIAQPIVLAVAALALAACGAAPSPTATTAPAPAPAPTVSTAAPTPAASPSSTPDETGESVYKFGQTTKPKGTLKIDAPVPFMPSSTAMPGGQDSAKFKVKLTNTMDRPVPATAMMFSATVNGEPAEQVFDSAKGLNGTPDSMILPGRSITFSIAFVGPADGDWTVDASSGPNTTTFIK